ncbi:GIY-YIG nuclease family protein [Pseudoalteromonas piscicida]|uniref:GIY-YIG nuclease family protein n=1 Tax=Pseudoalteromonas piscicida TaxID=43662 RepID=UPI000E35BCDB|nr:hypothetical protein D0N37_23465 [Pseudoalteromonas piscicida]
MELLNSVEGPLEGPYIYFIQYGSSLYIGETQKHPVIRWGQHLSPNSKYFYKLFKQFNLTVEKVGNVKFNSVYCGGLLNRIRKHSMKSRTQALEHHFHCLLCERPSLFGGKYNLISSTEKTAPRRFYAWDVIDEIAYDLVPIIRNLIS